MKEFNMETKGKDANPLIKEGERDDVKSVQPTCHHNQSPHGIRGSDMVIKGHCTDD